MRLVAAALAGLTVYLALGAVLGFTPELGALRRHRPEGGRLWLRQAGIVWSPLRFGLVSSALGGLVFLAVHLSTELPVVAAVVGGAVAFLPAVWAAKRRWRRLSEVQEAWPDGLRDLVASVGAGLSVARAIEAMASSGPGPLRSAFDRYQALARTLGVVPALEVIREQLADPTSDRVIEVLIMAHERGGSLVAEILSDLADMTSRDLWAREQIRSSLLEQKLNARIVFVLPWLVLVALTSTSEAYRAFYASRAGILVVAIAFVVSGMGMAMVARLGRDPEEPRVLGGPGEAL